MYVNLNINPKQRKASDCVIRTFALALNQSWEDTYRELCELGVKMYRIPNEKATYEKYAKNKNMEKKKIELVNGRKPTVESFADSHKKGTYILSVANHLVAVINGKYYDSWDCGHKSVYTFWEVTKTTIVGDYKHI